MRHVDHQHRKLVSEQVADGLPKGARRLHGHMGAARGCQPVTEHQRVTRRSAEGAELLDGLARCSRHQQACDGGRLWTSRRNNARRGFPWPVLPRGRTSVRVPLAQILVCVLCTVPSRECHHAGDRWWCLADTRGRLTHGLMAPIEPRPRCWTSCAHSITDIPRIFMLRWRF